jgi:hypothetical protein
MFGDNEDQKVREIRKARLDAIIGNRQILECTKCHDSGQPSVIAKDTINRSSSCYNCHREDIDFLVSNITEQVHIYHEGNTSVLPGYPKRIDYSVRHKEILGGCETCHVYVRNRPPECIRCHSGNHIDQKKGMNCLDCHINIERLFRHNAIRLEIHNIFGNESCRMCHSSDKITLELANGNKIPIIQASNLCKQCHSGIYKEWANGNHISSVECIICHNPHSPKNINQTILEIAKEITSEKEKKVGITPPKPEKGEGIIRRPDYDYNVGE